MKYKFRAFNKEINKMIFLNPQEWPLKVLDEEDNWKVMMWTGLLDRHGKEIWEGDILIDHKRKYICSWKKEETAFVIYGEDKYKNTTIGHRAGSGKWVQRYFVVIGNIYENPELIEG